MKLMLLFVFLVSAAGGFFYFLFMSSYFEIRQVEIFGLEALPRESVESEAEKIFEQRKLVFLSLRNYFLFPTYELQASLHESFPKIGEIIMQKISPDSLRITVKEREVAGVWCGPPSPEATAGQGSGQLPTADYQPPAGNCFYFDMEGVIFEEAPRSFGSLIFTVRDERDTEPVLGDVVLDEHQVGLFQDSQGIVARNFSFRIDMLRITPKGEVEFVTSEDWRVILDKSEKLEYQFSNLKYVLDEEVKDRRGELEYVDLRLGNRVHYKFRVLQP